MICMGEMMKIIVDITCIYNLPKDQEQLDNDRKTNRNGWEEIEYDNCVYRYHRCESEGEE